MRNLVASLIMLALGCASTIAVGQTEEIAASSIAAETSLNEAEPIWVGMAVVKDDFAAATCAAEMESVGASIDKVLDTVKIVILRIPVTNVVFLEELPCVFALELDHIVDGTGVAGATN